MITSSHRSIAPAAGRAAFLAAALCLGVVATSSAQRPTVARDPNPQNAPSFGRLEVTIEDLDSGSLIGTIAPKDVAVINVGQRVRLRMTVVPANGGPSRFPRTRFEPNQTNHIRVDQNDQQTGTLIVRGLRPHGAQGAVPIIYQVLESWPMPENLRSARIYVKVAGDASPPVPPAQPVQRGSVTFFRDSDFRGQSQQFFADEDRLDDNPIGNDTISSVQITPGCRVLLYRNEGFGGMLSQVTTDVRNLDGTAVGNDQVSSFRLECGGGGGGGGNGGNGAGGRGLTLYSDLSFRGENETFALDDTDLSDNHRIGNDAASSARLDQGCEAWLYADRHFQGASVYLTSDVPGLDRTALGNDRASSVRVRCR